MTASPAPPPPGARRAAGHPQRPGIRLGYSLASVGLTYAAVMGLAQEAERLGYDSVWAPEVAGADPLPLLGYIAGQTSTIGLGTAVLQLSARSAVAAATAAATLDSISGGRFRLGLGTSGPQVVEGFHGQPYARPLARSRDYLAVVRKTLAGEPVAYQGETLTLPRPGGEAVPSPALTVPPQGRRVPIHLAALGPRSVALAGEVADGWLAIHCPPRYLTDARAWLAEGAERGGRRVLDLEIAVMVIVHVDDDPDFARDMVRPTLAVFLGGMGTRRVNFYNRLAQRIGHGAAAARVQEHFLDGRIDEAITAVSDEMVDDMTLCGTPDVVRKRLAAYRDAGTTLLIAGPAAPTASLRRQQLRILATLARDP